MTIQGPPGNNRNHPEPVKGNGNASRAHQVPYTNPLPVDHLLGGIFALYAHCALLLDYVPPEEPPSTPLGNALRVR